MGYDRDFLGVDLPFPTTDDAGRVPEAGETLLDYVHFSVLLDHDRRLARATGVNIDGARLIDIGRSDDWRLDERVRPEWQAGAAVYARNDLDRGHLVRRRDPVWGDDAATANADTFVYPNAAPQASGFNQSKDLWLGLEDHVLAYAETNNARLSVFTAPVFGDDDPRYRGIRVPLLFWKVVAWAEGGELAAVAFLLDQSPVIDRGELERPATAGTPPLGPFRTFQVAVTRIESLAGVDLGPLAAADRLPATAGARAARPLASFADIIL